MINQIVFISVLILTLGFFFWSAGKLYRYGKLLKPAFKVRNLGKRLLITLEVAVFQTKILRNPVIGFIHAIVFWGFCVILFGSIEMVVEGTTGLEKPLSSLGIVYDIFIASGDVFAFLISLAILIFLARRVFIKVKRFQGPELKKKSKQDAKLALLIILALMLTLLGMNTGYLALARSEAVGVYPVSQYLVPLLKNLNPHQLNLFMHICWWKHIVLVFLFANILPYSKHFHVFMSVPNVFLSRLDPLGKITTMESIKKEVMLMMDPNAAFSAPPESSDTPIARFGVLDAEDASWKNYVDSLACTQCGRCTASCPANITGKALSPRKIFVDLRARVKEKAPQLLKNKEYTDGKSLLRDYISETELWACTTCNACAKECPINIDHPRFIIDMRRYLVLEESAAPAELNSTFTNIENNGAPWQFSPEDRMLWAEDLYINSRV